VNPDANMTPKPMNIAGLIMVVISLTLAVRNFSILITESRILPRSETPKRSRFPMETHSLRGFRSGRQYTR